MNGRRRRSAGRRVPGFLIATGLILVIAAVLGVLIVRWWHYEPPPASGDPDAEVRGH